MAYSLDIRKRAMFLVEEGKSFRVVGEMLGVSWWTVSNWHARYKEDRLSAEYPKRRGAYKINDVALIEHIKQHPDAYAQELAKVAGGTAQGIRDACKRLGITRKKGHHSTANVTKRSGNTMHKS